MRKKIHKDYKQDEAFFDDIIANYDNKGEAFGNQKRNSLRLFKLNSKIVNVKSFKIPNVFNQIIYSFFRKSKAQRSFEYAIKLKELSVGTPQPMAFYEFKSLLLFKNSYYVSQHLEADFTYRELTTDFSIPNHEAILRAFTRFTYQLHQKGIHFLDHSPGNTLIEINNGDYKFSLVDLNRMKFGVMDFDTCIKNMSKLTTHESMIRVMSNEYAKVSGENEAIIYEALWKETQDFQERFYRKKRLKKKLKFWKK